MNTSKKYILPDKQPIKPVLSGETQRCDSKLGLWLTHDPAIFFDPKSEFYYIYCTDAIAQRSKDLVNWEMVGKVVPEVPSESSEWVGTNNIWAPDIIKVGNEYRLYCSNSSWGVRQSCIFLAVSDNPEGPFLPRGCVLKTNDDSPVNAIDANIICDNETGETYMVYGSFWGGCYILSLDEETGLAREEGYGTCLARRPAYFSGAIEGPYMIYNEQLGFYYLFVSYGSLKSDYNIRVGRSMSIKGPFLDFNGRDLCDLDDNENKVGFLTMAGYSWNEGTPYMAPGHNSVLKDKDDQWYLVFHIREKNFTEKGEPSTLQIRKIFFNDEGWPVTSALPYCGEKWEEVDEKEVIGRYELIEFIPSVPQGICSSVPMKLGEEHYFENCSVQGKYFFEAPNKIRIVVDERQRQGYAYKAWDEQLEKEVIAISGMSEDGVVFWAKKRE